LEDFLKPGIEITAHKQFSLDLGIAREVEIDGIGMGVLSDGTAYLTARGLARLCGVDHTLILQLGQDWNSKSPRPRTARIKEALRQQGLFMPEPYISIIVDGTSHHAYPEVVCMAVLEYYAFDATQGSRETALRNYRLLARRSFREFIYAQVGYDPQQLIPAAWRQFHDRVSLVYDTVPAGYFSIFKEIADIVVTLINEGVKIGAISFQILVSEYIGAGIGGRITTIKFMASVASTTTIIPHIFRRRNRTPRRPIVIQMRH
jgi:hypothetical protein